MSDSRRVYRAIKQAVKQLYPEEPQGNLARHLETLAGMVSGIVLSQSCQLPKMASKVPGNVHPDSRTKQMSRWVQNEGIRFDLYFLPFVQPLLVSLAAARPLVFIMDGSTVARGCVTLMVSLQRAFRKGALFTQAAYGPVTVIAWWGARYAEPIYLVSNLTSVAAACGWYQKRMRIETFFSDQKSRGFQLHKSHLSDPDRVARLMLAACWAYLWVIYLGTLAQQDGWQPVIHRRHRCDLSLFQLGLRLLAHLLNCDSRIPGAFTLEPESVR